MLYISDDQMTVISLYYTTLLSLEVILISYFSNMLGGLINFSSKTCYHMALSSHLHIPAAQSLDRRQGVARTSLTNFLFRPVIQPQSLVIQPAVK